MTDHSEVTIYCLPFAGGSSLSYRDFQRHAGDHMRIVALDLPGRGRRFSEPLLTDIQDVIDDVFAQIRYRLQEAYAIYGHSVGAFMAYLLVKRIIEEGYPLPFHLFVSGREGPSVQGKVKNRHLLPRADFLDMLGRFEGTPREVIENKELMDIFEPILRADFQVYASYAHRKSTPFDIPITVMRGEDEEVTKAEALQWQEETTKKINLLEYPGGHFFIFKHAREIVGMFSRGATPLARWRNEPNPIVQGLPANYYRRL